MAQAEIEKTLPVDIKKLYDVIVKYEDYPKFVEGVTKVAVDRKGERKEGGKQAIVTYDVSMMKDVHYVLDHRENEAAGIVEWTLVESDTFKKNIGRWELKSAGAGKTHVKYKLEVEFNIPVPGFILNRLVKGSLPSMLESFEKRARA